MTDEWNETLRCPQCRKTGIASLSQAQDSNLPNVVSVADGFTAVDTQHGPNFQCGSCNVSVEP